MRKLAKPSIPSALYFFNELKASVISFLDSLHFGEVVKMTCIFVAKSVFRYRSLIYSEIDVLWPSTIMKAKAMVAYFLLFVMVLITSQYSLLRLLMSCITKAV
jgi:hypothetical protein